MLSDLVRQVRELPALPQALARVHEMLGREDVAYDGLAVVISHEPAFAADLLKLANSSLYGRSGRVGTVRDAISVLGLRNVGMALSAIAVRSRLRPDPARGFDSLAHWRHGVATGLCAHHMAVELRTDRDAAFTAGLLHDLGQLALACAAPAVSTAVLALAQRDDLPVLAAERQLLAGGDHAALGALVAERWHFGADIVQAIRWHHEPTERPVPLLVDLVHVANAAAHALDLNGLEAERVPAVDPVAWNRLALSDAAWLRIFEGSESQLQTLCEALGT
jgi:HD-like signal output (HDOD) protein